METKKKKEWGNKKKSGRGPIFAAVLACIWFLLAVENTMLGVQIIWIKYKISKFIVLHCTPHLLVLHWTNASNNNFQHVENVLEIDNNNTYYRNYHQCI